MTELVRCRRCGAMFFPEHSIERRCRAPLPLTGNSVVERWTVGEAIAAKGGVA
jgi:uncharacterized OB-fold protein